MAAADSQQHTDISFDAYSILGVPEDADKDQINTAYRKSAIKCHPDKFTDPVEKATKEVELKTLLLAYDTLIREDLRAKHDHDRRSPRPIDRKDDDPSRRQGVHNRQVPRKEIERKRPRESGMLVTAGLIENRKVHAMPDTGAGLNLISASLAAVLGYSRPEQHAIKDVEIRMANGKHLKTIGVIQAIWSFSPEVKDVWKLTFHIVEDFFYDAVLGNKFLMLTQTMSKHQYRLSRIPVPMKALSVIFVNTLGRVNQRVRGFINDVKVDALPDSGSESNLMSFDYCRSKGWDESLETRDTRLLLFPDGSIQQTLGTIVLKWNYGSEQNSWDIIMLEFHVLFGCVYDAILGQEMLEETSAFELHQESFLEVESSERVHPKHSDLNLVIWLPFRGTKRKASNAGLVGDNTIQFGSAGTDVHSELERRAAAESSIRRLPHQSERELAMAKERENRRQYDATQAQSHRATPSSSASSLPKRPESVNVQGMNLDPQVRRDGLSFGASVWPGSRS